MTESDGGAEGVETAGAPGVDLLEYSSDVIALLDDEWRITYVNEHAAKLIGVDADAATGTPLLEQFVELAGTEFERQYREALRTQESRSFVAYYEPMDAWFSANAYPSESGLSVFFRDVSERKETELALERDETALRRLHDVAADKELPFESKLVRLLELGCERLDLSLGFLTRIEDGRQVVVEARGDHERLQRGESCPLSQAYCKRTIEVEGLLATRDPTTEWVDQVAHDTFGLETYLGGKILVDGELYGTLCFADTERRARPFRSDERAFIELLVEWVAYELERERRERTLERKNDRLEAFASMVSHDLRNPLTVAQGNLDMIGDGDGESHEAVEESLDRMERLIDDMLWLAREGQDVGETEVVDLGAVANEAWRFVASEAATLDVDCDGGETVDADPDRLLQMLENLFRNAIEHAGPDVGIRVGAIDGGFYVEDDGPGIPADDRADVFDAGYTTDDGTGIGLAIVEQIATAHGWTQAIAESPTGGARFEFRADDESTNGDGGSTDGDPGSTTEDDETGE